MKYLSVMMLGVPLTLASVQGQAQGGHSPGQNLLDPDIDKHAADNPAADEQEAPVVGTVELRGGTAAAGVGYVWGRGVLKLDGSSHAFRIHGLSILDVGAPISKLRGM